MGSESQAAVERIRAVREIELMCGTMDYWGDGPRGLAVLETGGEDGNSEGRPPYVTVRRRTGPAPRQRESSIHHSSTARPPSLYRRGMLSCTCNSSLGNISSQHSEPTGKTAGIASRRFPPTRLTTTTLRLLLLLLPLPNLPSPPPPPLLPRPQSSRRTPLLRLLHPRGLLVPPLLHHTIPNQHARTHALSKSPPCTRAPSARKRKERGVWEKKLT